MKKAFLLLLISINAICQPVLKLQEESHDFGTIVEGTQASYTFNVENTGTEPLIISNVRPSCGCTTPDWTKSPIQPGKKGYITATFNSQGRPGAFDKIINIETNVQGNTKSLIIKGFVGPKIDKVYSAQEIAISPKVSIERVAFNFGKIEAGQTIRQKVKITNTGKSVLKVSGIQSGCHCVDYTMIKTELSQGETSEMQLLYKPKNQGDQNDIVTLVTNDIATKDPAITLKANVVPGFGSNSIMNTGAAPSPFK